MASPRLIVVPQYPSRLRYQEWWRLRFREYVGHFEDIIFLEPDLGSIQSVRAADGSFVNPAIAFAYEHAQMGLYYSIDLRKDDILLVCDISYPGMFSSVLYHKRPERCFAICHGTSINRYDIFAKDRKSKWKVETGYSRLFDKVFVATHYHKQRLGWDNCEVVRFMLPNVEVLTHGACSVEKLRGSFGSEDRRRTMVSVARRSRQKVNSGLEEQLQQSMGFIYRPSFVQTWQSYFAFLATAKIMVISSREETYGYQVADALSSGVIPVAPCAFSYKELLPKSSLYRINDIGSLQDVVAKQLEKPILPMLWEDNFIEHTSRVMLGS